ncbi:hypothetical protein BDV96DRAFT_650821 [Lophiotrema nucula]|uniref:Uncharacterized protein n=1 Tax=Lophiotrema nucula TaxID=690887 RepID=A0A6A5YUN4_9PLEO|nr:hypothetical protein BDV96DRAFT_650821 [Lophiotrema nucula]
MPWGTPRIKERITRLDRIDLWSRRFTTMLFPPPEHRRESNTRTYTYRIINPPPPQADPVLRVIKQTIRELCRDEPYLAAAEVQVWNATSSPPLWPLSQANRDIGIKFYLFKETYDEFHATHPVRVIPSGRGLTADMIEVRHRKRWHPLKAWLKRLPRKKYMERIYDKDHIQRAWWDQNGKAFAIMELPTEVRLILLQHILGGKIYPQVRTPIESDSPRITLGTGSCWSWDNDLDAGSVNRDIMSVSKLIRKESFVAAWEGTFKHFTTSEDLSEVINFPKAPTSLNWLAKINLSFSIREYFIFFGVTVHPFIRYDQAQAPARVLQTLTTLTSLDLLFFNPNSGDANPWRDWYYALMYISEDQPQYERMMGEFCHTPVVDWILTFALPFIKRIPKVYLSGCIKTITRKKWEHIIENEYLLKDEDYRTHGYDWPTAIEEIQLITENELPPMCHCPLPCMRSGGDLYADVDYPEFDYDDSWVPPPPEPSPPPSVGSGSPAQSPRRKLSGESQDGADLGSHPIEI